MSDKQKSNIPHFLNWLKKCGEYWNGIECSTLIGHASSMGVQAQMAVTIKDALPDTLRVFNSLNEAAKSIPKPTSEQYNSLQLLPCHPPSSVPFSTNLIDMFEAHKKSSDQWRKSGVYGPIHKDSKITYSGDDYE